jgi:hypothetical protein
MQEFSAIAQFLNPVDLANAQMVFSEITVEDIKKHFSKCVEARLKEMFGDRYEEFKKHMIKAGAVISGPFLLQCFYGETWENADFDIYFSVNDSMKPVPHFLKTNPTVGQLINFMCVFCGGNYCPINFANDPPETVGTIKINDVCLRGINTSDIYRFIREKLGMSVFKNMFYYSQSGAPLLEIANLEELCGRKTQMSLAVDPDFHANLRDWVIYNQYKDYFGFTFYGDPHPDVWFKENWQGFSFIF